MGIAFGIAVIVGVACGTRSETELLPLGIVIACLLSLAALLPRATRLIALAAGLGVAIGVGAVFVHDDSAPGPVALPSPAEIDGILTTDPRLTSSGYRVEFQWTGPDGETRRSQLFIPRSADVGRGDVVDVTGEPDGPDAALLFAERVELVEQADRVEIFRRKLRGGITDRVLTGTPGSNGSLALGLIIGDDSGLTLTERDDLRASGLSHITAVSGSNVSMVILVVAYLFRIYATRHWRWVVPQILAIAGYVWLVGPEPPIVRAAIMGSLALIAIQVGRPAHLFTLLFLAGGLMAALTPAMLTSLSFQLSFLSMIALGIVGARAMRMDSRRRQFVTVVASPAAAAIATAPLIAATFGTFSLGTVPANIIVAPLVVPATALAAFVAVVAEVPLVGSVGGALLWLATGAILEVARAVSAVPGAHWVFAPFDQRETVLLYLLLGLCAAPFVPELRLGAFKLRRWSARDPAVAFSTVIAGLALLGALAALSN